MEKEQTHLSSTASQPPLLDAPQIEKTHNLKRCCWAISSARLKMQAALCRREWCLCRRAKKRTRKKGEVKAKAHRKVTTRKTSCYVSSGWPRTLVTCDGDLFFSFLSCRLQVLNFSFSNDNDYYYGSSNVASSFSSLFFSSHQPLISSQVVSGEGILG